MKKNKKSKARDIPDNTWFMTRTKVWVKKQKYIEDKDIVIATQIGSSKTFKVPGNEEVQLRQ